MWFLSGGVQIDPTRNIIRSYLHAAYDSRKSDRRTGIFREYFKISAFFRNFAICLYSGTVLIEAATRLCRGSELSVPVLVVRRTTQSERLPLLVI